MLKTWYNKKRHNEWSDGMKGFVFFDLDGTLLNGESKVDKATAEAIQTLKDNGYEPFIATGRSPAETRDIMESANIHSGIFMNGQVVLYQGERVFSSEIPTETVERFHQMVKEDGYGLTAYNDKEFYLVESSAGAKDAWKSAGTCYNSYSYHAGSSKYLRASLYRSGTRIQRQNGSH